MSDENGTQNTTPKATATGELASKAWGEFKSGVKALFGPVASLVTARTLWTIPALLVLGWITRTRDQKTGEWVWTDLHAFGLSVLWVIAGISAAYVARKFLMPEVKASVWLSRVFASALLTAFARPIRASVALISLSVAFAVKNVDAHHSNPASNTRPTIDEISLTVSEAAAKGFTIT